MEEVVILPATRDIWNSDGRGLRVTTLQVVMQRVRVADIVVPGPLTSPAAQHHQQQQQQSAPDIVLLPYLYLHVAAPPTSGMLRRYETNYRLLQ